ncbi:MAG: hypothetical protein ACRED5_04860 [Propylenella sp.]
MIRILFGSALPILGLGAAAVLLGPDLVTGPRGEPLVVAAPSAPVLQEASFDGAACSFPLILGEDFELVDRMKAAAGAHVVTLAFRAGADGAPVAVVEMGVKRSDAAIVLVFNDEGRIVAVARPPSERERKLADSYAACLAGAETRPAGI